MMPTNRLESAQKKNDPFPSDKYFLKYFQNTKQMR